MKNDNLEEIISELYRIGLIDDETQEHLNDGFNIQLQEEIDYYKRIIFSTPGLMG